MRHLLATVIIACTSAVAAAKPYPDEDKAPRGEPTVNYAETQELDAAALRAAAKQVLRVSVKWNSNDDTFSIESLETEASGTDAFVAASRFDDPHGSFKAKLVDPVTGKAFAYSVMGTGVAFKHLARVMTFRFPLPKKPLRFELLAEHGETGKMESVIATTVDPADAKPVSTDASVKVRLIRAATASPKLIVNIYAEGYVAGKEEQFFREAQKIPAALEQGKFPRQENMEFRAVFAPSAKPLGKAQNLGLPVPVRDSFLGLYFPYWYDFGRYYHVLYPTSEVKYRRALAQAPYDYMIALVDDAEYWGVGNFKELTAIPARNASFNYLLAHEFGHFFGLNEEYESGGATELAFAPGIREPWSQNITFQSRKESVKWQRFIPASTTTPTAHSSWRAGNYGAYRGGYAETPKPGEVFKPGLACTMESGKSFCAVCQAAVAERVEIDLGLKSPPAEGGASCGCKQDGDSCALYKGSEKIAETALFGRKACDQAFCARYFKLTVTSSCGE